MTVSIPLRVVHAIEKSRLAGGLADLVARVSAPVVAAVGPPPGEHSLGHSIHPVLTDLPLGCWTSATLVDLVGGKGGRSAATRLVGIGVVAAGPTAFTGLLDWASLEGGDRRVGVLHAVGNDIAIGLFVASFMARLGGRHGRGVRLALLGNLFTASAGYLGGHLALSRATADRTGTAAER
jgi:uncharacterized membrane protein